VWTVKARVDELQRNSELGGKGKVRPSWLTPNEFNVSSIRSCRCSVSLTQTYFGAKIQEAFSKRFTKE